MALHWLLSGEEERRSRVVLTAIERTVR